MTRKVHLNNLVRLNQAKLVRLGNDLTAVQQEFQELQHECAAATDEIQQWEHYYRNIIQGEIATHQLSYLAEVRSHIGHAESYIAELADRMNSLRVDEERLVSELEVEHGVLCKRKELLSDFLSQEASRKRRLQERRVDEQVLIKWTAYENR